MLTGIGRWIDNCVLAIGCLSGVGWRCREFFPCFAWGKGAGSARHWTVTGREVAGAVLISVLDINFTDLHEGSGLITSREVRHEWHRYI